MAFWVLARAHVSLGEHLVDDRRVRRDYKTIRLWLEQFRLTERPGLEGGLCKELLKECRSLFELEAGNFECELYTVGLK